MVTLERIGAQVMTPVAEYVGLSTDSKPATAPNGSVFIEMDTDKVYFFSEQGGGAWINSATAASAYVGAGLVGSMKI